MSSSIPDHTARIVLLLSLAGFASSASLRALDTALPFIAAEFDVTVGQAALVNTAYALSYGLMQIAFGLLGDRIGKFRLISALALACALTSVLASLAPGFELLLAARLLAGATASAIIPMGLSWIGDAVPFAQRQPIMARHMAGTITGLVFGQVVGGFTTEFLGWRMTPVAIAALFAVVGLGLLLQARLTPSVMARPAAGGSTLGPLAAARILLADSWSRLVLLAIVIEGAFVFGALAFAGVLLNFSFGINMALAGTVLALQAIGGVVYSSLVGVLLPALGKPLLFFLGGLFSAVGFLLLAASPTLWTAPLAVFLVGAGTAAMHNTLQTYASQLLPMARGTGFAFFATCFFLSQSLGISLAGGIVDAFGPAPVFLVSAVAILLFGAWFATLIRNERPQAEPAPGK